RIYKEIPIQLVSVCGNDRGPPPPEDVSGRRSKLLHPLAGRPERCRSAEVVFDESVLLYRGYPAAPIRGREFAYACGERSRQSDAIRPESTESSATQENAAPG